MSEERSTTLIGISPKDAAEVLEHAEILEQCIYVNVDGHDIEKRCKRIQEIMRNILAPRPHDNHEEEK